MEIAHRHLEIRIGITAIGRNAGIFRPEGPDHLLGFRACRLFEEDTDTVALEAAVLVGGCADTHRLGDRFALIYPHGPRTVQPVRQDGKDIDTDQGSIHAGGRHVNDRVHHVETG